MDLERWSVDGGRCRWAMRPGRAWPPLVVSVLFRFHVESYGRWAADHFPPPNSLPYYEVRAGCSRQARCCTSAKCATIRTLSSPIDNMITSISARALRLLLVPMR